MQRPRAGATDLPDIGWGIMFYVLAVVTMTVGNFAALTQSNLKRMLAYSSIAHAGYLLIGAVTGTARGVTAMLVYLFVYAFMQLGAFAVLALMRRQDVVGDELKDLNGLFFRQPFAAIAMLLFMLSLGGIPPTAGFMGKFWLFSAAIESGYVWLAVIGVLNSAVSLYYYIRIVVYMMLKNEPVGSEPRQSPALAFAMGVAVVATLLLGVYPQPLFEFAQASAAPLGASMITQTLRRLKGHVKLVTEPLEPVFDPELSDHVFAEYEVGSGDLALGFAGASLILEGEYRVGHQEQLYIENQAMIAVPREDGGITVHASLQCPYYVHKAMQRALAMGERIRREQGAIRACEALEALAR